MAKKQERRRRRPVLRCDTPALASFLDGPYAELKDELRTFFGTHALFGSRRCEEGLSHEQHVAMGVRRLHAYFSQSRVDMKRLYTDHLEWAAAGDVVSACTEGSFAILSGLQALLCAGTLLILGEPNQFPEQVEQIGRDQVGCFGMTERAHGSNVRGLETEARFDTASDEFVINTPSPTATKMYIGGGGAMANYCVVFAQLIVDGASKGPHAFMVPVRDRPLGSVLPGRLIRDMGYKGGLNGIDNAEIAFDNVRIPRRNMLTRFGRVTREGRYETSIGNDDRRFMAMLSALAPVRMSVVMAATGTMKTALALAIRYSFRRRQFGMPGQPETPIIEYTTHQRRLMPGLATQFAVQFTLHHCLRRWATVTQDEMREVMAVISGLKVYSTRRNLEVLSDCRACCGGPGFMSANLIMGCLRDSEVFVTYEGDNTVLLQAVAKDLLTQYRKQMLRGGFTGILAFLASEVSTAIWSRVAHGWSKRDMLSHEWLIAGFGFVEARLLHASAMKLRDLVQGKGVAPLDAWNQTLQLSSALSWFHLERVALQRFSEACSDCPEAAENRVIMRWMCSLHGLARMEHHLGWFVQFGYLSRADLGMLRDLIAQLCADLTPVSRAIVDAWQIPEACLDVPMLRDEYTKAPLTPGALDVAAHL